MSVENWLAVIGVIITSGIGVTGILVRIIFVSFMRRIDRLEEKTEERLIRVNDMLFKLTREKKAD